MQNLSYKNKFDLDENEFVCRTHFPTNGFVRRLLLHRGERQSQIAYWPVQKISRETMFSRRVSPAMRFSNFACRPLTVRV